MSQFLTVVTAFVLLLLGTAASAQVPFPGAVLVNGGWVPCSHAIAIAAGLGCTATPQPPAPIPPTNQPPVAAPARITLGPCADASSKTVTLFGDGHIWRGTQQRDTFLALFNPTGTAQRITIRAWIEGYDATDPHYAMAFDVARQQQIRIDMQSFVWPVFERPKDVPIPDPPIQRLLVNFATEVIWPLNAVGTATLTTCNHGCTQQTVIPPTQACYYDF